MGAVEGKDKAWIIRKRTSPWKKKFSFVVSSVSDCDWAVTKIKDSLHKEPSTALKITPEARKLIPGLDGRIVREYQILMPYTGVLTKIK